MFTRPSQELVDLMDSKDWDSAMSDADSTCTTGYDNGGTTGLEIFENGITLGASAERQQAKIYIFYGDDDNAVFFLAKDEAELKTKVEALEDRTESEDDDQDDEDEDEDD